MFWSLLISLIKLLNCILIKIDDTFFYVYTVHMSSIIKLYSYKKCSTCVKAIKYLASKSVPVKLVDIRENPPSYTDLKFVLESGNLALKKLFNVSGVDYRTLNMKEKLPKLSEKAALELLSNKGNLIKRPLLVAKDFGLVGFNKEIWDTFFSK